MLVPGEDTFNFAGALLQSFYRLEGRYLQKPAGSQSVSVMSGRQKPTPIPTPICFYLFFSDVGDARFAEKEPGSIGGDPDAETIPVIIADTSLQPFPGFQHHRDLRA